MENVEFDPFSNQIIIYFSETLKHNLAADIQCSYMLEFKLGLFTFGII